MKTNITTLQQGLAWLLQGLYYSEKRIKHELAACAYQVTSEDVALALQQYIEDANNKLLKIERIFNYIMQEPLIRKNGVIDQFIEETHYMLNCTASHQHLKDVLLLGCIQNLNAYKTASYKTAYLFASHLELDTASDLLQQMLEWELAMGRRLSSLSVSEFNKTLI